MDRLPQELVLEILSRLPIPSLMQSRCVCRAWRIITRDQLLVNKHFNLMADNDPTFILQINDQAIRNNLYFGDFSTDRDDGNVMMITKKLPMPPLQNFHLGLYRVAEADKRAPSHHLRFLGFGFDPTTKQHKVVEVSHELEISYGGFAGHVVRPGMRRALHHRRIATSSIESDVHILSVGSRTWRNLGSFPFQIMWQQLQEVPMPDSIRSNRHFHELVVLRGCLSAVSFDNDNKELEIWVMKEYGVKESWVKEFSIGAYVPNMSQPNDRRGSLNSSMFCFPKIYIRVLCLWRSNGGILLEYENKSLVLYDPHCRTFNDLQVTFEGIPRDYTELPKQIAKHPSHHVGVLGFGLDATTKSCLSVVSFNDDDGELEIWVMKEYDVRESWVKEFSIGAYVPRMLQPNDERESLDSSMFSPKKCMRALCLLRSGGVLLDYRSKAVVYDPHCRTFQDLHLTFEGIQRCFRAAIHAACLSWIDTFVNT
ncbi:F-box and associated interaction domains-containing protein, putative isoform 1 [Hibiscus syriacus]|uniref:F-box and associated interaction domains-containing protein, putative isoform 1 n=1 Tax=Hibiscus syriacus TaxID=106335 RepID=A0A6A2XLW0_HIBSY|nr:F-box and associated interaction domains-containing protein, putative isoform 1 [Hibiscus syriacus]